MQTNQDDGVEVGAWLRALNSTNLVRAKLEDILVFVDQYRAKIAKSAALEQGAMSPLSGKHESLQSSSKASSPNATSRKKPKKKSKAEKVKGERRRNFFRFLLKCQVSMLYNDASGEML